MAYADEISIVCKGFYTPFNLRYKFITKRGVFYIFLQLDLYDNFYYNKKVTFDDEYGNIYTVYKGLLHNENGPAIKYIDGGLEYYFMGSYFSTYKDLLLANILM